MSAAAKEPQAVAAYGDMLIAPGTILGGKYEVEEIIGEGGMGIIARAINIDLHTTVAVKIMKPILVSDHVALARFVQEARAVSKLRSPHIVQMLDVNSHPPEPPFMVMELLSGEDLDTMVQRRGKLPPSYVIELVLQACAGVGVAHAAGILHRDLKPANLFLSRGDDGACVLKLLDFGLMKADPKGNVKLTQPNEVFGSPSFMSPEQISGEALDERTDVWALGVIMFELVTGAPAFGADNIPQTLVNVATREPPRVSTLVPDVPLGLEAAITRCLMKERTSRFLSVAELSVALEPLRDPVDLPSLLTGVPLGSSIAPPRGAEQEAPRFTLDDVGVPQDAAPGPDAARAAPDDAVGDPNHGLDVGTQESMKVAGLRRTPRLRGFALLALFGALVGVVVALVFFGSRSEGSIATSKNLSTSANVPAASSVNSAPTASSSDNTLGVSMSDPPAATSALAAAPKRGAIQRPPPSSSQTAAPVVTIPSASPPAPPPSPSPPPPPRAPAAPSTDPYPEFGRRK